jgi:hypothetical protein
MIKQCLVLLGFHVRFHPELLGFHFFTEGRRSRKPTLWCKPERPNEETSPGGEAEGDKGANAGGSEVSKEEDNKWFTKFKEEGGKTTSTVCMFVETKSLTLFKRALSAALMSALNSVSIRKVLEESTSDFHLAQPKLQQTMIRPLQKKIKISKIFH